MLASKINSQNLVPNNSFENYTNLSLSHKPNNFNQFAHSWSVQMDRWRKAGETTPDWFSSREPSFLGIANGQNVQPASGTEYAGIAPFEGIEIRLGNGLWDVTLDEGKFYELSFWFCAKQTSTQLKVHLRNERIPDNQLVGGNEAIEDWVNSVDFNTILSFNVDINTNQNYPGSFQPGVWYEFKSGPILMQRNDIKWLAITGDDEGESGQFSSQIIYIDEVSLNLYDICDNPCLNASLTGAPNLLYESNAMTEGQTPLTLVIENAIGFKFEVQGDGNGSGDGNSLFYYYTFNKNGLENDGVPNHFRFEWYGESHFYNDNMEIVDDEHPSQIPREMEDDVYVYAYTIYGCPNFVESEVMSFHYLPNEDAPYQASTTPAYIDDLSGCCRTCRYISNLNINEFDEFRASEGVYIGNSYDIFNNGPVNFLSDSDIRLYAGSEILIESEFDTQIGAEVNGLISECPYQQNSFFQRNANPSNTLKSNQIKSSNGSNVSLFGYPNPCLNSYFIDLSNYTFKSIKVYNAYGKEVDAKFEIISSIIQIETLDLSSGLYFIDIETSEKRFINKIIKQ